MSARPVCVQLYSSSRLAQADRIAHSVRACIVVDAKPAMYIYCCLSPVAGRGGIDARRGPVYRPAGNLGQCRGRGMRREGERETERFAVDESEGVMTERSGGGGIRRGELVPMWTCYILLFRCVFVIYCNECGIQSLCV